MNRYAITFNAGKGLETTIIRCETLNEAIMLFKLRHDTAAILSYIRLGKDVNHDYS